MNCELGGASQQNLLDQKRHRIIETDLDDIEMKPSSLSCISKERIRYGFGSQVSQKKFSADFNDPSFDNSKGEIFCNCKNSQCLKRYCECFTRMKYCDPNICTCQNCFNTNLHEVNKCYL